MPEFQVYDINRFVYNTRFGITLELGNSIYLVIDNSTLNIIRNHSDCEFVAYLLNKFDEVGYLQGIDYNLSIYNQEKHISLLHSSIIDFYNFIYNEYY